MTTRFKKATDALYKAFFEGTLVKGNCYACAVGNIITEAQQGKLIKKPLPFTIDNKVIAKFRSTTDSDFWSDLFCTSFINQSRYFEKPENFEYCNPISQRLFELTGYKDYELARVEYAFERNTNIYETSYSSYSEKDQLEDQYNGLVAVFDVLMKLDGIDQPEYKEKLKTHPKLVLA